MSARPVEPVGAAAPVTYSSAAQNLPVSATVTSPSGVVYEGTVTFTVLNGTTVIGTAVTVNVVSGFASTTYILPAGLAGGTYNLQVVYTGTANFATSTPTVGTFVIMPAVAVTQASSTSTTYTVSGEMVALTATVTSLATSSVNEGTETFIILSGATVIGSSVTVNVVNGVANATYTIPAGTLGGSYTIEAEFNGTSSFSSITDESQFLVINAAPTVSTNPAGQATTVGTTIFFTAVSVAGYPVLTTTHWQVSTDSGHIWNNLVNDTVYSGVGTGQLTITGVTFALNGYEYRTVFSNAASLSVHTTAATLVVNIPPTVTHNPSGQTINVGGTATFTAAATAGFPVATTTQWQVSTDSGGSWTNLADGTFYSGTTTDTLTVTAATFALNGDEYRAVFSNLAPSSAQDDGRDTRCR